MFFVIESIDGGGKGFQRELIQDYLIKNKIAVDGEEFPVHNNFYENVIHPALQGEAKMNSASWVLSYLLDKTLESERIRPFVRESKKHFLCDGYFTTTLAYQGYLMQQVEINKLIEYSIDFNIPKPDFAIYLDVDPKIALQRKKKEEGHDEGPDMFEKSLSKQQKLTHIFNDMVKNNIYCKWYLVNGNNSKEKVFEDIIKILKKENII